MSGVGLRSRCCWSACGGDDDDDAVDSESTETAGTGEASSDAPSQGDSGEALDLIFVSHAAVSDPFWVIVNNGFEEALGDFGDSGVYRAPSGTTYDVAQHLDVLEQAIAADPDGLIVTNQVPNSLTPVIARAVDAGIPVVVANAGGAEAAKETGALAYVGTDEEEAGRLAGERLASMGAKRPILVTTVAGFSPTVDNRNAGFESAFPEGDVIVLGLPRENLGNASAMTAAIEATLTQNPDADAVFSIGSLLSPPMLAARESLGDRADDMHWASIDLGEQVVTALENGEMDFALDQQQWLQGYESVKILDLYIRYGLTPADFHILTGPSFVTADLLDRYAASIEAGVR